MLELKYFWARSETQSLCFGFSCNSVKYAYASQEVEDAGVKSRTRISSSGTPEDQSLIQASWWKRFCLQRSHGYGCAPWKAGFAARLASQQSGPGRTSKPAPYESQETSRCAACSNLCSTSCAFAGQGTTPHTTPVMLAASQGIALALSKSLLSDHSQVESKPGRFSTDFFLIFCRTGLLQHIHIKFISTPLLLILTGFNTMVYTLIFPAI